MCTPAPFPQQCPQQFSQQCPTQYPQQFPTHPAMELMRLRKLLEASQMSSSKDVQIDDLIRRVGRFESKYAEYSKRFEILNTRIKNLENRPRELINSRYNHELADVRGKLDELRAEAGLRGDEEKVVVEKKVPIPQQLANHVTSIVGLRETVESKLSIHRFLWGLLFLAGLAATIFFLYKTTEEYFDEPTLTKVKLDMPILYDYPPMVFAHEAWFDVSKAESLNLSLDGLKYALGFWRSDHQLEIRDIPKAKDEFYRVFNNRRFKSLLDFYDFISVDLRPVDTEEELANTSASVFMTSENVSMAKTFLPYVSFSHAFSIPPADDRMGVLQDPPRIVLKYRDATRGLLPVSQNWMLFHSRDPDAIYSFPLSIRPFTQTFVKVDVKSISSITSKGSPCQDKFANSTYDQVTCMIDCQNREFQNRLNCQLFWLTTRANHNRPEAFCNDFEPQFNTDENSTEETTNFVLEHALILQRIKETCLSTCPKKCKRLLYSITSMGEDLVLKHYQSYKVVQEARKSSTKSNFSVTAVFFIHDAIHVGGIMTINEVSSYSYIELVNRLGGTLGLFIGGTLMTLAQFAMFVINYCCERRRERRERAQMRSVFWIKKI